VRGSPSPWDLPGSNPFINSMHASTVLPVLAVRGPFPCKLSELGPFAHQVLALSAVGDVGDAALDGWTLLQQHDIGGHDLPSTLAAATASTVGSCQHACEAESTCRAFTWPGCQLKDSAAHAGPNTGYDTYIRTGVANHVSPAGNACASTAVQPVDARELPDGEFGIIFHSGVWGVIAEACWLLWLLGRYVPTGHVVELGRTIPADFKARRARRALAQAPQLRTA
jgi:hypothetical protein